MVTCAVAVAGHVQARYGQQARRSWGAQVTDEVVGHGIGAAGRNH